MLIVLNFWFFWGAKKTQSLLFSLVSRILVNNNLIIRGDLKSSHQHVGTKIIYGMNGIYERYSSSILASFVFAKRYVNKCHLMLIKESDRFLSQFFIVAHPWRDNKKNSHFTWLITLCYTLRFSIIKFIIENDESVRKFA